MYPNTEIPTVEKLKEQELEERRKEIEDLYDTLKTKISENNGIFSETLKLSVKGGIDWSTPDGNLASSFAHLAIADQDSYQGTGFESAFRLAKEVSDKFPNLHFNFVPDPDNGLLKYSVTDIQQPAT